MLELYNARSLPRATIGRGNATDHVVALDDLAPLLLAMITTPNFGPQR